jgi:hypothetical protein
MDCERHLEELVEEPEDGVLPVHVREHLASCLDCRRLHQSMRRGRAILRSLPSVPVSDRFVHGVERRIERLETRRRVARSVAGAAGRFAVAGAVAALVYLLAPAFAGRLIGPGRPAAPGHRLAGLPAVTVLRPLSRFAGSAEASLFAGPTDLTPDRETLASPAESAAPFTRLIAAHATGTAEGVAPTTSNATGYRRQPAPGAPQPILVTTPSWTFAAPPAAFHFVSARSRSTFPTPAR